VRCAVLCEVTAERFLLRRRHWRTSYRSPHARASADATKQPVPAESASRPFVGNTGRLGTSQKPLPPLHRHSADARPGGGAASLFLRPHTLNHQGEDVIWLEWYWHGTRVDGTRLEVRGVTIFGVQDDRILWGRLFMDEVDRSGEGIDQAVREITTSAE
jgi:hypothetical protein